jgi:regulation of enolase protein 1 (concanavalin A-like superfamily)
MVRYLLLLFLAHFQKQIIMYQLYHYFTSLFIALVFSSALGAQNPAWSINAEDYQYSASINAAVLIDGQPSLSIGDQVALFAGDELRGISEVVPAGGSLFHFITVYANVPVGEEMEIKVYRALDNEVYTAFTTYTFQLQDVAGNFEAPFKIEVRTDGDFPIAIQNIPVQSSLQGFPFASIDLSEYLDQTDTDPVVWGAANNPLLSTSFNGAVLQVTVNDPNWFGSTDLVISAVELGLNGYFAFKTITFEVRQAFSGPLWDIFLGESVLPGQPFTDILLDDFEIQHEGNCLEYSLQPVFEAPEQPLSRPNWQADIFSTPSSMPIVAQVQFTPAFFFNNPSDLLGAFINGEVRGSAEPLFVNGTVYYFLQVQNELPGAQIELKFYSATHQQIFDLPYTLMYNGIEGIGTIESPVLLDFSPFVFDIASNSETLITAQDDNWQGFQSYLFTVADCDYPGLLLDQTEVTYCVDEDNDDDGFCNLIDPAPEDRCIPDYYPPVIKVLNEQENTLFSQQAVSHEADQGDCTRLLSWTIEVAELCEVPQIDVQISCQDAEVAPAASAVLESTGLDQATFNLYVQASVGINQLLITATDSDGNTSRFTYQIEVTDTQAPTPVCQFAQVWLNPEGQGMLNPEEVLNTALSYDNCSIEQLSVSKTDYDCSNLGSNFVTLTATDKAGNTSSCNTSISVAPGGELPGSWQSTDIGQVTTGNTYFFDPCTAAEVEDGEYSVVGSGNNATSSTTDNVAFASQSLCGDGSITARIESVTPNGYGGLMIRESNAAGAKQVAVFSNLTSILRHETRYANNSPKQVNSFFKPSPFWLRLERAGPWIFSYYSTTGFNFQYVHGVYLPMQECVEIGLSSFTFQPFTQTEAVFSFVSLEGNGQINNEGIQVPEMNTRSENGPQLRIFPNPASKQVRLVFDAPLEAEASARLISQLGDIMETKRLEAGRQTTLWDISELPAGVYTIQLNQNGRSTAARRLVKTK